MGGKKNMKTPYTYQANRNILDGFFNGFAFPRSIALTRSPLTIVSWARIWRPMPGGRSRWRSRSSDPISTSIIFDDHTSTPPQRKTYGSAIRTSSVPVPDLRNGAL
jgi:hypothetical protein